MLKVPETPYWLLSKNQFDAALKSLQWYRGWVSERAVQKEFIQIQRYRATFHTCNDCRLNNIQCKHTTLTLNEQFSAIKESALVPIAMVLLGTLFIIFNGITTFRSYLLQILRTFKIPIDSNWASVRLTLCN